MNKTAFYVLIALLLMAGCSKVNDVTKPDTTTTDFTDSYADINDGSRDNSFRKTNMKIVIRPVNNAINTYRLVIKVDTILVDVDSKLQYIDVPASAIVKAGLSRQDPNNLDKDLVVFAKEQLTFRREIENGYAVFVSDPFATDAKFDYQLVNIDLSITMPSPVQPGAAITFTEAETHMVLPNGRTLIQNPEPEKLIVNVRNNGNANVQLTISGDPARAVSATAVVRVRFNNNGGAAPPPPPANVGALGEVLFNKNTGVVVWRSSGNCLGYLDEESGQWKCTDAGFAGGLMLYLFDNNGKVISSHFIDDWQGETNF